MSQKIDASPAARINLSAEVTLPNDPPLTAPAKKPPAVTFEPDLSTPDTPRKVPPNQGKAPMAAHEIATALRSLRADTKQLARMQTQGAPTRSVFAAFVKQLDAAVAKTGQLIAAKPFADVHELLQVAVQLHEIAESTMGASGSVPPTVEGKARTAAWGRLAYLLSSLEGLQRPAINEASFDTKQAINMYRAALDQGRLDVSFYAKTVCDLADSFAKFDAGGGISEPHDFAVLARQTAERPEASPFSARMLGDLSRALGQSNDDALTRWHDNYEAKMKDAPVDPEEAAALNRLLEQVSPTFALQLVAPRVMRHHP